jgi:crotonobetainyl-CoA:carnitine CoA-transferase CaiB-like acyl-CoA transferase
MTGTPCYTASVRNDSALLTGIVVLDLTRVLAGPYCTRLLADLGARVIKIERPGWGDEMRRAVLQLEPGREDQSTYFVRCNAGKESVALDLGHPAAQAVVLDLARAADVVVENFVPDVTARLGCDYEALAAVKPDLIYCSISGYGQTGPWRLRPAFAHLIHAASGMMHLEQGADPAPRSANLQAADVLAGTHAFGSIVAALWRRARTGQGARLDVSMLETLVAADDMTFGSVLNGGPEHGAPRIGMIVTEINGRYLALQTGGAAEILPRLVSLMGHSELIQDPRFSTPAGRRDNWAQLRDIIQGWLKRFATVDEAVDALSGARVPCAPVLSPAEVVALPHLAERQFFPSVPHPGRGEVRITRSPFQLDGRPVLPQGAAPYRVGEHTRAVLEEFLGYDPGRIEKLLAQGAAAAP